MEILIIIGLLVVAALALTVWGIYLEWRSKELKKERTAIEHMESLLSDARDSLMADQKTLENRMRELYRIEKNMKDTEQ